MWGLASLDHRSSIPFVVDELMGRFKSKLRNFNSQELGNLAWGLASLLEPDAASFLFEDIVDEAYKTLRKFSSRERSSLLTYLLVMQDAGKASQLSERGQENFKDLLKDCSDAWESVMTYPRATTRHNDEVERILNKLCLPTSTLSILHTIKGEVVTERCKTEDNLFFVDLALHFEQDGEKKKVAIFIDGSLQFPSGTGGVCLQR